MLMNADAGEGGVKNHPKSADVVYGRPLRLLGHPDLLTKSDFKTKVLN